MGYRSDLYFKCAREVMPELMSILIKQEYIELIEDFKEDEFYYSFRMMWVKWYSPEIENFISRNDEKACMIRKGEEDSDVEVFGDAYSLNMGYYLQFYVEGEAKKEADINTVISSIKLNNPELFI